MEHTQVLTDTVLRTEYASTAISYIFKPNSFIMCPPSNPISTDFYVTTILLFNIIRTHLNQLCTFLEDSLLCIFKDLILPSAFPPYKFVLHRTVITDFSNFSH